MLDIHDVLQVHLSPVKRSNLHAKWWRWRPPTQSIDDCDAALYVQSQKSGHVVIISAHHSRTAHSASLLRHQKVKGGRSARWSPTRLTEVSDAD